MAVAASSGCEPCLDGRLRAGIDVPRQLAFAATWRSLLGRFDERPEEGATGEAAWRRRFTAAARAGGLLLYESDRRTGSITWEGDTRQLLGYEPAEMGGYAWWYDRVHPDDRELVGAAMALGLTFRQPFVVEYRLRRADGSYCTVLDQAEVKTGPDAEVVRVVGTVQDITARRQAEEHRARLAAIVEASEDAVVSATLDGVFTSWNDSAERLFGCTAEEAIGTPITLILPEDLLDERREIVEKLRRGERIEHCETFRLTKSGQRIPVSVSFGGIRNARGELGGSAELVFAGNGLRCRAIFPLKAANGSKEGMQA